MDNKICGRFLICLIIAILQNVFSIHASNLSLSRTIFNSADETIVSEERYQNYTLTRYSNGYSKLSDNSNNWIVFKTQYEVNSFTGETSDNPVKAEAYIKKRLEDLEVVSAIVHDRGYNYFLGLENDTVFILTPGRVLMSTCIIPNIPINSFFEKKQSKSIYKRLTDIGAMVTIGDNISISLPKTNLYKTYWILNNNNSSTMLNQASNRTSQTAVVYDGSENQNIYLSENRMTEINRMLPRIFLNPNLLVPGLVEFEERYSISAIISLLSEYSKIFGNETIIKTLDGNKLVSMEGTYLKLLNGDKHEGGYFDPQTGRMYFSSKYNYILQACSMTSEKNETSSLSDDNTFWIKCLPKDTIKNIKLTDKVGELYFSNGDYLKFSKIKGGLIYDCHLTRPTGLCVIKLDTDKPVSYFKCTQGRYCDITCELKNRFYDDLLTDPLLLDPNNNPDLERAYENGTRDENNAWDEVTIIETVSSDSIEAAMKAKKQKEIDNMISKYGKKYVDAILNDNKILIGTPEGLIVNHLNSSLIRESQYSRMYRIGGLMGGRAATVVVDVTTKRVSSVTY